MNKILALESDLHQIRTSSYCLLSPIALSEDGYPIWANFVSTDADGYIWAWYRRPFYDENLRAWYIGNGSRCPHDVGMRISNTGKPCHFPENSLLELNA